MLPSTLAPDQPSPFDLDRRQHPRFELVTPVTLLVADARFGPATAAGRLKDISEGGCYFDTSLGVAAGKRVSVAFVAQPRTACWALGSVVRAVEGRGFGVKFDDVSDTFRQVVASLASAPLEQRGEVAALIGGAEMLIS